MNAAPSRWHGLALALVSLSILAAAAALEPDSRGFGTHEQLGLPACSFHAQTGLPCPTCGVTTAFTHIARGHWLEACATQPFGAILGIAVTMIPFLFAASLLDRRLDPWIALTRFGWLRSLGILAIIGIAVWIAELTGAMRNR